MDKTFFSYIKRDEIIALTAKLIEKKTINPPGNEYLAKEIIVKSLEDLERKRQT